MTDDDFPRDLLIDLIRRSELVSYDDAGRREMLKSLSIPARYVLPEARTEDVPSRPATGATRDDIDRPAGPRRLTQPEFLEALVNHVALPGRAGVAVALARRAVDLLPEPDRVGWADLLAALEQRQLDQGRRQADSGRSPDLSTYDEWVGFDCQHRYSLTDRFFGRTTQLDALDAWARDPAGDTVLCVTALGGAGKSALAWRWVNASLTWLRGAGYRGVFWCSFYERTLDFERFLHRLLVFCGRSTQDEVTGRTRAQVERDLLDVLRRERFLVVIDGLEREMTGYVSVAERGADDEGERDRPDRARATPADRRLTDPRDSAFLRELAAPLAARVLITTRLRPADLENDAGDLRPHVDDLVLRGLDGRDAAALWDDIVPTAPIEPEVAALFELCDHHPLVISVLARSVVAHGGTWQRWRRAPAHRDFKPVTPPAKMQAHVIDLCLRDLDDAAVDVLSLLSVTGKPMTLTELDAALRTGTAPGGADWTRAGLVAEKVTHLVGQGLVGEATVQDERQYDLHPVIRGTMWSVMVGPRRQARTDRFFDHAIFELGQLPEGSGPIDLRRLDGAVGAFQRLVDTGQWDRAWTLLRYRLLPPMQRQGAYRELLDLFQLLYGRARLRLLPLAARRDQSEAIESLAHLLVMSGDATRGDTLLRWAAALRLRIKDVIGFMDVRLAQAWEQLYEGRLYETETALRRIRNTAAAAGLDELYTPTDCWIGLVLALRGDLDQATEHFHVGTSLDDRRRWWAQGTAEGYVYAGDGDGAIAVLDRLAPHRNPFDPDREGDELATQEAWEQLTRGMALVIRGEPVAAVEHLSLALQSARRADYKVVQCFALPWLAEVALQLGDLDEAERFVRQYAEADPVDLYRVAATDAWRIRARCALARGDRGRALDCAIRAYELAACDGPPFVYRRGLRQAEGVLRELGAYLPRVPSRLDPDWAVRLGELTAVQRPPTVPATPSHAPADPVEIFRENDLHIRATEEDEAWWELVVGPNPALNHPLNAIMIALGVDVGTLRQAFDRSEHKSLEVVFYQLNAERVLLPDRPRPVSALTTEQRDRWLSNVDDLDAPFDAFLAGPRAGDAARAFDERELGAEGIAAFLSDAKRRIRLDAASPVARRWWDQLEHRRSARDMLILADCIQAVPATLDAYVMALSTTGRARLEYGFLALLVESAVARHAVVEPSRTEGWSPFQLLLRLQAVKYQLGWLDVEEPARELWRTLEERHERNLDRVVQLAESLALRGATIGDFHQAYLLAETEDVAALLAYVDYLRLRHSERTGAVWPDDISVRRWSYDDASPTFTETGDWTDGQVAQRLATLSSRLKYADAPAHARKWWDELPARHPARTLVRFAEEAVARWVDLVELHRRRVEAGCDVLPAVVAYLDFALQRERGGFDASARAQRLNDEGKALVEVGSFAEAVGKYEAAIAVDPTYSVYYSNLADAWERQTGDPQLSHDRAIDALQRGVDASMHSSLSHDLERVRLWIPNNLFAVPPTVAVEVGDDLATQADPLVAGVEPVRQELHEQLGITLPGVRFRRGDLLPGQYVILLKDVPVADGFTYAGARFVPGAGPAGEWAPRDPADGSTGDWQTTADETIGFSTPEFVLRHVREVATRYASKVDDFLVSVPPARTDPADWIGRSDLNRELLDDGLRPVDVDDPPMLAPDLPVTEQLRHLRRLPSIRQTLPGNRPGDVLVRLDPAATAGLHGAKADGLAIVIPAEAIDRLLEALRTAFPDGVHPYERTVLVVDPDLRRTVRLLVRERYPALAVIAEDELLDHAAEQAAEGSR